MGDWVDVTKWGEWNLAIPGESTLDEVERTQIRGAVVELKWPVVHDIFGIRLTFETEETQTLDTAKIWYWQSQWPSPGRERFEGARSAWIGVPDDRHGQWVEGLASRKNTSSERIEDWRFDPLDILEVADSRLEWSPDYRACFRRTNKIYVLLAGLENPSIRQVETLAGQCYHEVSLDVHWDPAKAQTVTIDSVGGDVLTTVTLSPEVERDVAGVGDPKAWMRSSLGLRVQGQVAWGWHIETDRTIYTLCLDSGERVSFYPDEALREPIWIPDYGVVIHLSAANISDWNPETVRDPGHPAPYSDVDQESEQTYERAYREIPRLDIVKQAPFGRYVILGWHDLRQKFALRYNGEIFADKRLSKLTSHDTRTVHWASTSIHYRVGSGEPPEFRDGSHDVKQWLAEPETPIYTTQWLDRELEFTQSVFARPIDTVEMPERGDGQLVALVRWVVRNTTADTKVGRLWLDLSPQEDLAYEKGQLMARGRVVPDITVDSGWQIESYLRPQLRGLIHPKTGQWRVTSAQAPGVLTPSMMRNLDQQAHFGRTPSIPELPRSLNTATLCTVTLAPWATATLELTIPFSSDWEEDEVGRLTALDFETSKAWVRQCWQRYAQPLPAWPIGDRVIRDFARAVPWHIAMTADYDEVAQAYVVPAASYGYGACGNEAAMQIRALDYLGYHHQAAKFLETFVKFQGRVALDGDFGSSDGALAGVNFHDGQPRLGGFAYNLDHGYLLECLADHFALSGDEEWLKGHADALVAACDFIRRERQRTQRLEAGEPVAEWGLLPMGHLEDNQEWKYWFAVNAHAYRGLLRSAQVLAVIDQPIAESLFDEAQQYRADIRRAAQRAMQAHPVVRTSLGTWVPHIPGRVGLTHRDAGWLREVAYGALHLATEGVLDVQEPMVTWLLQTVEDAFMDRRYGRQVDVPKRWFSQGGVTIQANLLSNGPLYLRRGQYRHAIRALYNNFLQHIYDDVLVFSEHPVIALGHGLGPFYKTPDEAQFLVWIRTYLMHEEDDELWLAAGVPRSWLRTAEGICVENMPTFFGSVSYRLIVSDVHYAVEADITAVWRRRPTTLRLWIRHPKGLRMASVIQSTCSDWIMDPEGECLIFASLPSDDALTLQVRIAYG